jgi:hypothetical protein
VAGGVCRLCVAFRQPVGTRGRGHLHLAGVSAVAQGAATITHVTGLQAFGGAATTFSVDSSKYSTRPSR